MIITEKKKALRYADKLARYAFIYLAAAIFCALFGAVYEIFSHDVFSYFMIYAFAIPLVLGAFPMLWIALRTTRRIREVERETSFTEYELEKEKYGTYSTNSITEGEERTTWSEINPAIETEDSPLWMGMNSHSKESEFSFHLPGSFELNAWGSGIAALTVGSIFRGVLDIYGTTNKLWIVYPIVGLVLLAAGMFAFFIGRATVNHARRKRMA